MLPRIKTILYATALGPRAAEAFQSLVRRAQVARPTTGQQTPGQRPLPVAWQQKVPVVEGRETNPILKLYPTDLNGDGTDEILVLRAKSAHCFDAQGKL